MILLSLITHLSCHVALQ